MPVFSCYVDYERFLGEPVKDLAAYLSCLKGRKREEVILNLAYLFKKINRVRDYYKIKNTKFLSEFNLSEPERQRLSKLINRFFLKQSENSSGRFIPQDSLVALRKGRLFEEIVYMLGPIERERVDLTSMHCQPMLNGKRVEVRCGKKVLTRKNIDVVFWGRKYVEAYECKSNVPFFLYLGKGRGERARKVRDKVRYLNQTARILNERFGKANIYLASFAPDVNLSESTELVRDWISSCGDSRIRMKLITIKDFLKRLYP